MRATVRSVVVCVIVLVIPRAAGAQSRLVDPRAFGVAPSYAHWSFSTPFVTDGMAVSDVTQIAVPVKFAFTPAHNWRVDASAAITKGTVTIAGDAGESRLSLDGLTDAKIRVLRALAGERVWLTLGANLPTGLAGLDAEQTAAIRVLGAPALRMQAPVLGSGLGVIAGAVYTGTLGDWAVGLGASFELRGTYTPLEAQIADGGDTVVDLKPAGAVHLSLGLDRVVGQGRLSILFTGDRYATDVITLSPAGGPATESEYRLGPTFATVWAYRIATPRVRDLSISAAFRHRSEFTNGSGEKAPGSSGNSADARIAATIGRAGRFGLLLAFDGVFDSGLDIDDTVATAAMTSATFTLGVDRSAGRVSFQPFVRGGFGSLDVGTESTTGIVLGVGLSIRATW